MATTTDFVDQKKKQTNNYLLLAKNLKNDQNIHDYVLQFFFFVKSISRKLKQYIYKHKQTVAQFGIQIVNTE